MGLREERRRKPPARRGKREKDPQGITFYRGTQCSGLPVLRSCHNAGSPLLDETERKKKGISGLREGKGDVEDMRGTKDNYWGAKGGETCSCVRFEGLKVKERKCFENYNRERGGKFQGKGENVELSWQRMPRKYTTKTLI